MQPEHPVRREPAGDHLTGRTGLAPLLRPAGGELTPIETLAAHYASPTPTGLAIPAGPDDRQDGFRSGAQRPEGKPRAHRRSPLPGPELPDTFNNAAAVLRTRLQRIDGRT
ncbi:hypothetical protein NKH18_18625 [Streptomyces sp. M10(2022)]